MSANGHNGSLRLIDRARDFLVTAGGKTISPSLIENALRASPVCRRGCSLRPRPQISYRHRGDRFRHRRRLGARQRRGLHRLHQPDRAPTRRTTDRVELDKVNRDLARVEQIKSFRILPKALDPEEEGEPVTPTRKVKRKLMYERFRELVEAMYDDREERLIAAGTGNVLAS